MTRRIHPAIISTPARVEFAESIRYVKRDSPQNARAVRRAIKEKIDRIRRFPESAPVDRARELPGGATPHVTHASEFVMRFAFPVSREGREVVFVVSIQRAGGLPPDETEYTLRLLQELAAVYA